jgi:hypothetical protein
MFKTKNKLLLNINWIRKGKVTDLIIAIIVQTNKMVENYENRIKSFIYEMATSPIKIKDYSNNISSTRQEFLEEENQKIIGSKGFVFKSFKTEKERVADYLKERNTIFSKINVDQIRESKSPNPEIVQPSMRFKPRTDLERIYDTINTYSYGKANKSIIDKQLRQLDLNVSKRNHEDELEFEEIPDYTKTNFAKQRIKTQDEKMTEKRQQIKDQRKETKNKIYRKFVDNSEARNLMSELHYKTHFKGAAGFTLFKNSSIINPKVQTRNKTFCKYLSNRSTGSNQNILNNSFGNNRLMTQSTWRCDNNILSTENSNPEHTIMRNSKRLNTDQSANSILTKTYSKLPNYSTNKLLLQDPDVNHDIAQTNPLLYNLNFNPYRKEMNLQNQENGNAEQMEYLRCLAFRSPEDHAALFAPKSPSQKKTVKFFVKLAKSNKKVNKKVDEQTIQNIQNDNEMDSLMKHNPLSFFQRYADNPNDMNIKNSNFLYRIFYFSG